MTRRGDGKGVKSMFYSVMRPLKYVWSCKQHLMSFRTRLTDIINREKHGT